MKYIVLVPDGAADYPLDELKGKTPLQAADMPETNTLARRSRLGLVRTVPEGMPPGSDTANLSVMGYDPLQYYSGRSPFEAAGMGVELEPGALSFRCNLVTLSSAGPYEDKEMLDYSAGEITTPEARALIETIDDALGNPEIRFYPGISYRHLMIWSGAPAGDWQLTPPHDIIRRKIRDYLPAGPRGPELKEMMKKSFPLLSSHRINQDRQDAVLNLANSIWLWGEGTRPSLMPFREKYGLKGSVISAVDLIKGIGLYAGLEIVKVEGATGNIDTNYAGKAEAALEELKRGQDFVYIHIEAPDECGHQGRVWEKVKSLEKIDQEVVRLLRQVLDREGEPYSIMIVPDHATPLSLRTHTGDPVPFLIFRSNGPEDEKEVYAAYHEREAQARGLFIHEGFRLMDLFLGAG